MAKQIAGKAKRAVVKKHVANHKSTKKAAGKVKTAKRERSLAASEVAGIAQFAQPVQLDVIEVVGVGPDEIANVDLEGSVSDVSEPEFFIG